MINYDDIKIPGQEEDLKGQTNQLLAASRLKNTIGSIDTEIKSFNALLNNSMRNTYSFNEQQKESLSLIAEEVAADRFSKQFKPERIDEEMEALAKEAGYESRGKIYFGRDDTLQSGYMGHAAAVDAGNMFSGNFELIATNQAAFRTKTQMMGSNALLSKSKAWDSIKGNFNLSGPDKEYYQYHTETGNNWGRLPNINSVESLARAVPIIDPLYHILADQTPEEKFLARKEPWFNGESIVNAIAEGDPDFLAFLNSQGVDLEALKEAANPFHFRWIMNTQIQANAMSSSIAASEAYHSSATDWALFGADQLKNSLTSGDFVGQVVLTAATMGLGSVVAGAATIINAVTAASRVRGAVATSKTAIQMAQAGKTIREMKNWLPVNLPTTLMRKASPTGLSFGKGGVASFGAWTTGQAIEGFLEEGLTDIFNQVYETNEGFRLNYNYDQMWKAALMGAAMEPILGGAINVATIPVNITLSAVGSTSLSVGEKLFSYSVGMKPSRIREMNLYFDEFMGKFESLSPESQQIRISMITSGLVTEAALNEATGGEFGQIDSPENQLLLGRVLTLIDGGESANPIQGREFLSNLSVRLQGILKQLVGADNKSSVLIVEENGEKFLEFAKGENRSIKTRIRYTEAVDKVIKTKDGTTTFTKAGTELLMFAMIVNAQSSSETSEENIVEMMAFLGRERLQESVKKNNKHLDKETLSEEETKELTDRVFDIITTDGETEFTKIMDEINASFEVLQHIDLDLQEDVVSTVMIQTDPEVVKRILESKRMTRAQIQKGTNATPVPQAAPVAPQAAPVAPKASEANPVDPRIVATAAGRKRITVVSPDEVMDARNAGLVEYPGPPGITLANDNLIFGRPDADSEAAAKELWEIMSSNTPRSPEINAKLNSLVAYTEITEETKTEATPAAPEATSVTQADPVAPTLSVVFSDKLRKKAKEMGISEEKIKKAEELGSSIADNDWFGLQTNDNNTEEEDRNLSMVPSSIILKEKTKSDIFISHGRPKSEGSLLDSRITTKSLEQALAEDEKIPQEMRRDDYLHVRFVSFGLNKGNVTGGNISISLASQFLTETAIREELAKRKAALTPETEATPAAPKATTAASKAPAITPTATVAATLTLSPADITAGLNALPPELLNALNKLPPC